jgi:hypothetical protein
VNEIARELMGATVVGLLLVLATSPCWASDWASEERGKAATTPVSSTEQQRTCRGRFRVGRLHVLERLLYWQRHGIDLETDDHPTIRAERERFIEEDRKDCERRQLR